MTKREHCRSAGRLRMEQAGTASLDNGMAAKRSKRSKDDSEVPYQVHVLESWEAFLDLITDSPYANWAFRGQCEAAWPLFSALSRYLVSFRVHPDAWRAQESRMPPRSRCGTAPPFTRTQWTRVRVGISAAISWRRMSRSSGSASRTS